MLSVLVVLVSTQSIGKIFVVLIETGIRGYDEISKDEYSDRGKELTFEELS